MRRQLSQLGAAGIELGLKAAIFGLLYDSEVLGKSGGTGASWNWKENAESFREFAQRGTHALVAGGLTARNVAEALRVLRPWGVDVVSGVEARPGKKDPKKLRAFIQAVREADKVS